MWSTNRATSFPTSTAARSMVKATAVCSCGSRMSKSQQAPWKRSRVIRASLGSISTSAHQVWAARRVVAARADGERRVDVEAVEDVGDRVAAVQQTEGPGGLRDRERVRVLVFERVDVVDAELLQHGGASGGRLPFAGPARSPMLRRLPGWSAPAADDRVDDGCDGEGLGEHQDPLDPRWRRRVLRSRRRPRRSSVCLLSCYQPSIPTPCGWILWILTKSGRPAKIRVSYPVAGIRMRG